jgi:hypothetical protein
MVKINVSIDDKIEENFRKEVYKRKGMKKGNISEALEEAINSWIRS